MQVKFSDIYFDNQGELTKFGRFTLPLQGNRNMAENMSSKFYYMERSGTFVLVAKIPSIKCIQMLMLTSHTFPYETQKAHSGLKWFNVHVHHAFLFGLIAFSYWLYIYGLFSCARSGEVKGESLKELLTVFQKSFKHQPIPAVSLA